MLTILGYIILGLLLFGLYVGLGFGTAMIIDRTFHEDMSATAAVIICIIWPIMLGLLAGFYLMAKGYVLISGDKK